MKKLAIVALISGMTALTACSKPVTEVKNGEAQGTVQQKVQLSTDNKADIQADIDAVQAFGLAQEKNAESLQAKMESAMKSKNQQELNNVLEDFKIFVAKSNDELNALTLKSTEVNRLREKMIENSLLGLEVSQILFTTPADKVDPAKVQPLQEKAMKAQQELMLISQEIQEKIQDKPAVESITPPAKPAQ